MEQMVEAMKPILPHRDKIGYICARNTRILRDTLTEYVTFKEELIKKYGEVDKDEEGNELPTISVAMNSPNFKPFIEECEQFALIDHEVELMIIPYEEVIGLLNGEEILKLEFMFTE